VTLLRRLSPCWRLLAWSAATALHAKKRKIEDIHK
jgi:hypothetical protein